MSTTTHGNPRHTLLTAAGTIALTLRTALEHHDCGELEDAAALYREVLGIDPVHAQALFLLSIIEEAAGNQHSALQLLRRAVQAQPASIPMQRALAQALSRAGHAAAALKCCCHILSLEPASPLAYVEVANAMTVLKPGGGNDTAAAACYRRALVNDARCAPAHKGLGDICQRAGELAAAEKEYRAAISIESRNADLHAALAGLLFRRQQFAAAADACRQAILLKPGDPGLLQQLGDALHQLGHSVRADACYRRALELEEGKRRASARAARSAPAPVPPTQGERQKSIAGLAFSIAPAPPCEVPVQ